MHQIDLVLVFGKVVQQILIGRKLLWWRSLVFGLVRVAPRAGFVWAIDPHALVEPQLAIPALAIPWPVVLAICFLCLVGACVCCRSVGWRGFVCGFGHGGRTPSLDVCANERLGLEAVE